MCYNPIHEPTLGPVLFSLPALLTEEGNLIQRRKKWRENANTFETNVFDD